MGVDLSQICLNNTRVALNLFWRAFGYFFAVIENIIVLANRMITRMLCSITSIVTPAPRRCAARLDQLLGSNLIDSRSRLVEHENTRSGHQRTYKVYLLRTPNGSSLAWAGLKSKRLKAAKSFSVSS